MYNEERKKEFLAGSNNVFKKSVFAVSAKYEEKAGVDLCMLPEEYLQEMFDKTFGRQMDSRVVARRVISNYVKWCKEKGYDVKDSISNVDIDTLDKIKKTMIASPAHLQRVLDLCFDPVDSGTIDTVYRCFAWLMFAGMKKEDTVFVKVQEVDFNKMEVRHEGKTYKIYREAIETFHIACDATEFLYTNQNYKSKGDTIVRNRILGDFLFRGMRGGKGSGHFSLNGVLTIYAKRAKDAGSENLTPEGLRKSGLFYEIFESERSGGESLIDSYAAEITHNTKSKKPHAVRWAKKKQIREDYERWKKAFSV